AGPLPDELRASAAFFVPIVVVGFAILLILASQRKRTLSFGARLIARLSILQRWNVIAWLEHFLDGLAPLTRRSELFQVLLLTTASWICSLASGYVLMIAFFGHGDWATTCLFSAAASLAVAVPAVPGNLGTYEVSILLALRAMGFGDPIGTATAFAVAVHAVNLLVNSSLGVYGFFHEGVSLGQLSQGVREMKTPSG
ncbi:MAG: lysylphosphatidylglycerol synthase domain-containing protein, partial [Chloroflexota bacterium]